MSRGSLCLLRSWMYDSRDPRKKVIGAVGEVLLGITSSLRGCGEASLMLESAGTGGMRVVSVSGMLSHEGTADGRRESSVSSMAFP